MFQKGYAGFRRLHGGASRATRRAADRSGRPRRLRAADAERERADGFVAVAVRYRGVRFGYDGRATRCCAALTLHIDRPGRTVALVGPSGGGKTTTVLSLLPRFYDPTGGARWRSTAIDVRGAYAWRRLRDAIGIVQQDVYLFGGHRSREHRLRQAGRFHGRRDRGGGARRAEHPRLRHGPAGRLRHLRGRARGAGCPAGRSSASPSPACS